MPDTMINPAEEGVLDFSADTAVDEQELAFTIVSVEEKQSESAKGSGSYYAFGFESADLPFPVTVRLFTEYNSATGASTDWVKKQRGTVKRIAMAALGTKGQFSLNPSSPLYIVGHQVLATTTPDDQDRLTLKRFKPVS